MRVGTGPRPVTVGILCSPIQKRDQDEGALSDYIDAVTAANARPELIVMCDTPPAELLKNIDGLLIPGGADVDPALYNQARTYPTTNGYPLFDRFEYNCIQHALTAHIPMLGICRGMQLMNVAAGGTLIQDINTQTQRPAEVAIEHQNRVQSLGNHGHVPVHVVQVVNTPGRTSNLESLFDTSWLAVNSAHHQALAAVGPAFAVTALALDGIVEGIERKDLPSQWGVQWHPERQRHVDPSWGRVFDRLVSDAHQYRYGEAPGAPEKKRRKSHGVAVAHPQSTEHWKQVNSQLFPGLPR